MYVDDLCKDYKLEFGIKFYKLRNRDLQLCLSLNKNCFGTYIGDRYEYCLYLCLFKFSVSIGWFLEEIR